MRKCCESYYFMFHIYFLFPVVYCARFLTIHAEGHPHTSFVQWFFRGVAGLVALGRCWRECESSDDDVRSLLKEKWRIYGFRRCKFIYFVVSTVLFCHKRQSTMIWLNTHSKVESFSLLLSLLFGCLDMFKLLFMSILFCFLFPKQRSIAQHGKPIERKTGDARADRQSEAEKVSENLIAKSLMCDIVCRLRSTCTYIRF